MTSHVTTPTRPGRLRRLTRRLLPALELTRMSMVFTAIADGVCSLLLLARQNQRTAQIDAPITAFIDPRLLGAMVLISIGLYGFGMALNDIIDHRRDRQLAAHRPLPSGRMSVWSAHLLCFFLAALALAGGSYFALHAAGGWRTLVLVAWVGSLISFYDLAGKYLVGPGLFTLGLIRFFHALIPAPSMPLLWHPLLLMNHIVLLSIIVYLWRDKRPALTRAHFRGALAGLAGFDLACILIFGAPRLADPSTGHFGVLLPLTAAGIFALLAVWIRRASAGPHQAADRLMRLGLGWLILYDAAFVAGYINWTLAGLIAALLPMAWLVGRIARGGLHVWSLRQPPPFKRPETP